jgi:hypothetical protein
MDRDAALVSCTVFLLSVPVLLWMSRFSPEAWMLYFTLWSIHLSLRELAGRGGWRTSALMGACTALAILSKLLVLPLIALNLFCLMAGPRRAPGQPARLGAYALGVVLVSALLLTKIDMSHLAGQLFRDTRANRSLQSASAVFQLPHQRPLLVHHGLVFILGAAGVGVLFAARPTRRTALAALTGTILLLMLITSRRPYWHYFYGFYWFFPVMAAAGLAQLIASRQPRLRRDTAAIAAGVVVLVTCNAWAYPSIVSTYREYLNTFRRRAALLRADPVWAPAPWELPFDDYEQTRDPDSLVSAFGGRLTAVLQRERRPVSP